jgi:hypothetical protein
MLFEMRIDYIWLSYTALFLSISLINYLPLSLQETDFQNSLANGLESKKGVH